MTRERPEVDHEEQSKPSSVFRLWRRQITFVLLGLSITLLGSVVLLLVVFQGYSGKETMTSFLGVALLGGIFGGSTRAMYMFILEMRIRTIRIDYTDF